MAHKHRIQQRRDLKLFPVPKNILFFVPRVRTTVEYLSEKYHDGGNWGNGLAGYCGIASRFLVELTKFNGIDGARFVCGTFDGNSGRSRWTHCWVEYKNFCIDLTISQFESFEEYKYKICRVTDSFYKENYQVEFIDHDAITYQSSWDEQAYEPYAKILWYIYSQLYK